MTERECSRCGRAAEGAFCSWCGAALGSRDCTRCGAELEPGARFCNQCGAPLAEEGAAGAEAGAGGDGDPPAGTGRSTDVSQLGWWVAGGTLVALILIVAYPVLRQDAVAPDGGATPAEGAAPGAGASSVDLSSMTPREAADQLFDRVMRAASAGDSAEVRGFLPMSIQAYERARPLDVDGLFHLALMRYTGGDGEGALATALEGLEEHPSHLLNLGMAAQAAVLTGAEEVARGHYGTLLDVWDEELGRGVPEYEAHGNMLPGLRQEALDFVGR